MARGGIRKWIGAIGVVLTAGFALPAQAVFFSSNFDPLGPTVAFTGSGLFEFDDACLAADNTYTAAQCHLQLVHADANVTDDGAGGTANVHFGSNTASMVDLIISGGTLAGINTNLIGPAFTNDCTPQTGCTLIDWWIQWQSDPDPVFLGRGCDIENGCDAFGIAPTVTFTLVSVPEPATLSLLFGALGAFWFARRRRLP
ncbi:MAG TPA: PEP-CTERM sorting domain-containing protein [Casimicrobiaceae bacterium]|nr:PEP-CTERM sorting domain-containing protein [Casimicrobiaceae bacterium]